VKRPEPMKIRVTETLWLTVKEIEEQLADLEEAYKLIAFNRTMETNLIHRLTSYIDNEIKYLKGILKYDE
jgi:hypothetical protein